MAFNYDGSLIVSTGLDKKIYIWNAQTGEQIRKAWEGHTGDVLSVAFSGDGSRVVSTSSDGTLRQWGVGTGNPIGNVLEVHARSAVFSHDGRRIIAGGTECCEC